MTTKLPYIDTGLLRAALTLIATNDDPRPITKGIHVNSEYVEATNGHALVRMKHHAEFHHDITVRFNDPVPDDAEFSDIKVLDDGLCVAVYYLQDSGGEFRSFSKSVLTAINIPYPDTNKLLKKDFVKGQAPLIASRYLALPYLMFGRGTVDILRVTDEPFTLFTMDALTAELYGEPLLLVMPVHDDSHELAKIIRDEMMEGDQ